MKNRELTIYTEGAAVASNTANVATPILTFTVPVGVRWLLRRLFRPKSLKLVTAAGADIARNSRVSIYRKVAGQEGEEHIATFGYDTFYGLTVAQQGDVRNNAVMTKDLGLSVLTPSGRRVPADAAEFRQDWQLIIKVQSADVVDLTHANASVTFDVGEDY